MTLNFRALKLNKAKLLNHEFQISLSNLQLQQQKEWRKQVTINPLRLTVWEVVIPQSPMNPKIPLIDIWGT